MDPDLGGDLDVDVLVIGAGIQGLYIAHELARTYTVAVVSHPTVAASTLESSGYFSAGYDGNDANRIQPARRAAGWWRLWAETHDVAINTEPPWFVVEPDDVSSRTRLWADAMLGAPQADALPPLLADGSLGGAAAFVAEADVVIDPATVLDRLRTGIGPWWLEGEVVRFGLAGDDAIDHVQVQVGDDLVPVVPRFVVAAAGVGNADLLTQISSRFGDHDRRKASKELVDRCQAVRSQPVICLRGADLPALDGRFGALTVASHRLAGTDERVWLVEPPIDDRHTTAGPDNVRFERPVDSAVVAATVERLLAASPTVARLAPSLRWSTYVTRCTQHPMLLDPDPHADPPATQSLVAQPVPAKLEKLGLDGFLAVWPSHLAFAQFVGDAVAERVREALGPAQDFGPGLDPSAFGAAPATVPARWAGDTLGWLDWDAFAAAHGIATA
jgi:hypothetical protein